MSNLEPWKGAVETLPGTSIELKPQIGEVILHDAATKQWLYFQAPRAIITASDIDEVLPALRRVEALVKEQQLYAAGFISYEAAPAFDRVHRVRPHTGFPLVWFGIYSPPAVIRLPRPHAQPMNHWQASTSPAEYAQAIAQIKTQIAQGHTYQVNYTFRLNTEFYSENNAWQLFLTMAAAQPAAYAAYVDTGDVAICSASPELFFTLQGTTITCRPMKGTAGCAPTSSEDQIRANWLHQSAKNRAENVMIVDMIRNDLGRVAEIGSVQAPRLFEIERYPTLWQMTSTVTATTSAAWHEIIQALFPCASITGAPKIRTMQIIADLETTPRRIYTGSIGYLAPDRRAQFSVAIRNVLVDRTAQTAEYGTGSGVVWDSTDSEEYEECLVKAHLLTQQRPSFSLLESLLWEPDPGYFLLEFHLKRLKESADYFDYRYSQDSALEHLTHLANTLPPEPHKVRLLMDAEGLIRCEATPLAVLQKPTPAQVKLAPEPVDSQNLYLYHKTTHRQVYEAAQAACPGCDEVILWNERREITEAATANIVVQQNGKFYTPPITSGLLAGAFRAWLLETGQIQERTLLVSDLPGYERIFLNQLGSQVAGGAMGEKLLTDSACHSIL